ncbi:MAG: hypothetical protein R2911_32310 [Caldilineaceae bacterium]
MLKIRHVFIAFCLPLMLLAGSSSLLAAQWHSSNQVTWTVAKACRDGALIKARYVEPPITIMSEEFDAHRYLEEFAEYPVLIDAPTYDATKIGDLIGTAHVPRLPAHDVPLIVNWDEVIGVHWNYTLANLYWSEELPVGEVVALQWRAIDFRHFVLAVEDCYIAPDALVKSPALTVKATVGLDPDTCATSPSIVTAPSTPIYACLVIANPGDVTFDNIHFRDELAGIDTSFALTITPGTSISITHAIAQAAGLPFDLGPYDDEYDAENILTWDAADDSHNIIRKARVAINRNNPAPRLYFMPIVKKE